MTKITEEKLNKSVSDYKTQLDEDLGRLLNGLEDTEYLLKETYKVDNLRPHNNSLTEVLRKSGTWQNDLQKHLVEKVIKYFSNFDSECEVKIEYENHVPCNMLVKYKGYIFMSFSFYYHTYKPKYNLRDVDYMKREIKRQEEDIADFLKKYGEYHRYQNNLLTILSPRNYTSRGIKLCFKIVRDFFLLAKTGRKQIKENIDKSIKKIKSNIQNSRETIDRCRERIKEVEEINPAIETKYNKWKEKLESLGYKEKEFYD